MTTKYQLVLQWNTQSLDYDSMLDLEEQIEESLDGGASVDGHDAGSSECNIFVMTDDPYNTFAKIERTLQKLGHLDDSRIAYRELAGTQYSVIWPKTLKRFSVI